MQCLALLSTFVLCVHIRPPGLQKCEQRKYARADRSMSHFQQFSMGAGTDGMGKADLYWAAPEAYCQKEQDRKPRCPASAYAWLQSCLRSLNPDYLAWVSPH